VNTSDVHRLIADRYLLQEQLGSGGMGTVWRAADQLLERVVAVKELRLREDGRGEGPALRMRRALREARTIARVAHPHVIDIYDLVEHDGRLWIVMELVDGPSLDRHLATEGPLPVPRIAETGLQLLGALEAVHAVGALHRDVKPANVLLRRDGSAVLTDFGIAALIDDESLTGTGGFLGSVEFTAPERLQNGEVGPPSDLFSLGATLCVLASGRSPFARPAPAAVLHAVAFEEPVIPAELGPLRPLVAGLLRKDPAERPSPADAARALQAVSAAGAIAYTKTQTVENLLPRPSPRRRRLRWAVPSAAALLVAGGTAGFLLLDDASTSDSRTDTRTDTQTVTVSVSALRTWQRVDTVLRKGDQVSVRYLGGTWTVDRNLPRSGPEGFGSTRDSQVTAVAAQCKVDADVPFATLLARFTYEPPAAKHSLQQHRWTHRATADGRLALRINDADTCLTDNAGAVRVEVRVTRAS
jgi:serine/threonine protein kinase